MKWAASKPTSGDGSLNKLIYPLQHVYTKAELAFSTLKGIDSTVARVLGAAAREADCAFYLAQISIEESGSAEADYSSYRHNRWREEPNEDDEFEVIEVVDCTQAISEWRSADEHPPVITAALPFLTEELCLPDSFTAEPDEQHFHEATGNEGASFERTYRRAAFVLWPRSRQLAVLHQGGADVCLPWLADLAQRWVEQGEKPDSPLWQEAYRLTNYLLCGWE